MDGITAVDDFSDKHGMRMVIELRRDVRPKQIVNYLLKHTAMRQTFGIIMLALVNGQPRILTLGAGHRALSGASQGHCGAGGHGSTSPESSGKRTSMRGFKSP